LAGNSERLKLLLFVYIFSATLQVTLKDRMFFYKENFN